ncbi:hypothetical protein ACFL1B_05575 [Nanoarchaeota archaeon]
MLLKYKREVLNTFFFLVVIRIALEILSGRNPFFFPGLAERLNIAIAIVGVICGLMYLPYDKLRKEFGKIKKRKRVKIPNFTEKQNFGLGTSIALGFFLVIYVLSLIFAELEIGFLSSTVMLIACAVFALLAIIYPYEITFKTLLAYNIILGALLAWYFYLLLQDFGYAKMVIPLLLFIVMFTTPWVIHDE